MVDWTMTPAAKSHDRHAGGDGRRHADSTVFDYDALLARRIELPGREQEEVGGGLTLGDLRGAEDVRIEERQQPGYRERVADPVEVTVRSDATRHRERRDGALKSMMSSGSIDSLSAGSLHLSPLFCGERSDRVSDPGEGRGTLLTVFQLSEDRASRHALNSR